MKQAESKLKKDNLKTKLSFAVLEAKNRKKAFTIFYLP